MGVSINGGIPIAGWFIREDPNLKWMITSGTPMTMETPHSAQRHTHHGTQDSSVAGPDEVALKTAPWQVM